MARRRVYVDIETTGLKYDEHAAIEIAYMTDDMTEPVLVIPWEYNPYDPSTIFRWADPKAMEINKFLQRYSDGVQASPRAEIGKMIDAMRGSTLVGANVRFDARMIEELTGEVWHHRLFDIEAWSAGIFGVDFPIGWTDCVRLAKHLSEYPTWRGLSLQVVNDHTAVNDCSSVHDVFHIFNHFSNTQTYLYPVDLIEEIREKNESA